MEGDKLTFAGAVGQWRKHEESVEACLSVFYKFVAVMAKIQSFFMRNRVNAPLLHGQRAEQHINRPASFIAPEIVYDKCVDARIFSFNESVDCTIFGKRSHLPSDGNLFGLNHGRTSKFFSCPLRDIRVPRTRIKQRPKSAAVFFKFRVYSTHAGSVRHVERLVKDSKSPRSEGMGVMAGMGRAPGQKFSCREAA